MEFIMHIDPSLDSSLFNKYYNQASYHCCNEMQLPDITTQDTLDLYNAYDACAFW